MEIENDTVNKKRRKSSIPVSAHPFNNNGYIPPQAVDVEEAILGCILMEPSSFNEVRGLLHADHFYKESSVLIYGSIVKLIEGRKNVDQLTITNKLKEDGSLDLVGGPFHISQLCSRVSSSANIVDWALIVIEKHLQRTLIQVSSDITKEAYAGGDVLSLIAGAKTAIEDLTALDIVRSKTITCNMEIETTATVLMLNDRKIASVGNIGVLIAPPGSGKTQVCGAICASLVNPACDTFGFKTERLLNDGGALYIDTELSWDDAIKNMHRIKARCDISQHPELLLPDGSLYGLRYENFRGVYSLSERKLILEGLIRRGNGGLPFRLLIIDGITDFIADVNDTKEGPLFISWLIAMANQHKFAIFCTIHDNPANSKADNKGKARGTVGSELGRKAESMMYMKKHTEDKSIRVLTFGFNYAKVRNDSDEENDVFIRWDNDMQMMMTVSDTSALATPGKTTSTREMFVSVFKGKEMLRRGDIEKALAGLTGKSASTASRHIDKAIDLGILVKNTATGVYKLTSDDADMIF